MNMPPHRAVRLRRRMEDARKALRGAKTPEERAPWQREIASLSELLAVDQPPISNPLSRFEA